MVTQEACYGGGLSGGRSLEKLLHNVSPATTEETFLENAGKKKLLFSALDSLRKVIENPRVSACHRVRIDEEVTISIEKQHAHFGGLVTCRSKQCPVCYTKRAAEQHDLVFEIMRVAEQEETPVYSYMGTLTISHGLGDSPGKVSRGIRKAFRAMLQGKWAQKLKKDFDYSYISKFEVTFGQNGWHPHIHFMFLTPRVIDEQELDILRRRIFDRWKSIVEKHIGQKHSPLYSCFRLDPRNCADYLTELKLDWQDLTPKNEYQSRALETASHEIADLGYKKSYYGRTPLQLLIQWSQSGAHKEDRDIQRYLRYQEETSRLKELTFSGDERMKKWRKEAQRIIDEEKEKNKQSRTVVAVIPGFVWDSARSIPDFRPWILFSAEHGGIDGIKQIVLKFCSREDADCIHEPWIN